MLEMSIGMKWDGNPPPPHAPNPISRNVWGGYGRHAERRKTVSPFTFLSISETSINTPWKVTVQYCRARKGTITVYIYMNSVSIYFKKEKGKQLSIIYGYLCEQLIHREKSGGRSEPIRSPASEGPR